MTTKNKKISSIAYFGSYDSSYARVNNTLKALRKNNIKVYECKSKKDSIILRLFSIAKQYLSIFRKIDVLMVCEAGHAYVPLAKLLSVITRKPLAFDVFISQYHVNIIERKKASKNSLKSFYFYYLDKISILLSDLAFMDTPEHVNYICNLLDLSKNRFDYFFIGVDDDIFNPKKFKNNKSNNIRVLFIGSFIPLHGVEFIVKAANILDKTDYKVEFIMLGEGMTRNSAEKLSEELNINNLKFKDPIPYKNIPKVISKSDICLGQFSSSKQMQVVIPIKIYEALAMKKPVITGNSRSVSNIFKHKKSIYFCEIKDEKSLANSIKKLADNQELRNRIANNGLNIIKNKMTTKVIGKKLAENLSSLISD